MRLSDAELKSRHHIILDAAAKCFRRNGTRGTTIQEICEEGQFSAGLIYHYFKSKQDIVEAIAERLSDQELADLKAVSASIETNTTPEKVIAALVATTRSEDDSLALSLLSEAATV